MFCSLCSVLLKPWAIWCMRRQLFSGNFEWDVSRFKILRTTMDVCFSSCAEVTILPICCESRVIMYYCMCAVVKCEGVRLMFSLILSCSQNQQSLDNGRAGIISYGWLEGDNIQKYSEGPIILLLLCWMQVACCNHATGPRYRYWASITNKDEQWSPMFRFLCSYFVSTKSKVFGIWINLALPHHVK